MKAVEGTEDKTALSLCKDAPPAGFLLTALDVESSLGVAARSLWLRRCHCGLYNGYFVHLSFENGKLETVILIEIPSRKIDGLVNPVFCHFCPDLLTSIGTHLETKMFSFANCQCISGLKKLLLLHNTVPLQQTAHTENHSGLPYC